MAERGRQLSRLENEAFGGGWCWPIEVPDGAFLQSGLVCDVQILWLSDADHQHRGATHWRPRRSSEMNAFVWRFYGGFSGWPCGRHGGYLYSNASVGVVRFLSRCRIMIECSGR